MGDVLRVEVKAPETTSEAPKPETTTTTATPEKFKGKSIEEVITAYTELEKKLGQNKAEPTPAPTPEQQKAETTVTDTVKPADLAKYESEFLNNGKLSDASYKELSDNNKLTKEQVDQYISGRQAQAKLDEQEVVSAVGGAEKWNEIKTWATKNLSADEIKAFNTVVNNPDKNAARLAVDALESKFTKAFGKAPNLVNAGSQASVTGFRSLAEMTKAMSDKRYSGTPSQKDPAYIADVQARVEQSNF